ncbi:MAG TPA: DUF2231 domain-containing protein [Verrucomicrobiae bacterium]|jgi:uncharacterized membrane protein
MKTPTSFDGHPLHPILVSFPIGLLGFSIICDIIYMLHWGSSLWADVALYTMAGGIIGAIIAAVPGLVDLNSIRDPRLKHIGVTHMTVNLVAVLSFIVNWLLRYTHSANYALCFILSLIGIGLISFGGWLGASLVHHFGVTVDEVPGRQR